MGQRSRVQTEDGRIVSVDITVNERQFMETPPLYANVPNVTFDGVNFHVVFFTNTPAPLQAPGGEIDRAESSKVRVAARLVLPPLAVEATINALIDAYEGRVAQGLFAPIYQEESDYDGGEQAIPELPE